MNQVQKYVRRIWGKIGVHPGIIQDSWWYRYGVSANLTARTPFIKNRDSTADFQKDMVKRHDEGQNSDVFSKKVPGYLPNQNSTFLRGFRHSASLREGKGEKSVE